jgi:hypothetical protein
MITSWLLPRTWPQWVSPPAYSLMLFIPLIGPTVDRIAGRLPPQRTNCSGRAQAPATTSSAPSVDRGEDLKLGSSPLPNSPTSTPHGPLDSVAHSKRPQRGGAGAPPPTRNRHEGQRHV